MPLKRKGADRRNEPGSTPTALHNIIEASPSGPTNAASPPKRQRVSRACDQCRSAREKCDGVQPLCYPCVLQNRRCTYAANPKKRGVQVGYIRALELALAWIFEEVSGCEDALADCLAHDTPQTPRLLVYGRSSRKPDQLHKKWRKSRVLREITRILASDGGRGHAETGQRSDKTLVDSDSEPGSDKGMDAAEAEDGRAYSDVDAAETTPQPLLPTAPSPMIMTPMESSCPTSHPTRSPGGSQNVDLKLPPNHWRLLDIYFSYTHCWFPILNKQDVLKTVYLYGSQGLTMSSLESTASHTELWSVLALASYQDAASQRLTTGMASSSPPVPSKTDHTDFPSWKPHELYQMARRLIPSEDGPFQIQHATALLLLSLINIGRQNHTAAWMFLVTAKNIALELDAEGAGQETNHPQLRPEKRKTTAVLIGCSILETLLSVLRKKTPSAVCDTCHYSLPEDEMDEWQPWIPCHGFGQDSQSIPGSRTPAHSLTTFNQLHSLFQLLRHKRSRVYTSRSGADPPPGFCSFATEEGRRVGHTAAKETPLQYAIRPNLPFGTFVSYITSPPLSVPGNGRGGDIGEGVNGRGVPSAHVLRFLFIWMQIQLIRPEAPTTDENAGLALFRTLLGALEQFVALFGICGFPPLLSPCLAMLREHRMLEQLHDNDRRRWHAIHERSAAVWNYSATYGTGNDYASSDDDSRRPVDPSAAPAAALTSLITPPPSHFFSVPTMGPSSSLSSYVPFSTPATLTRPIQQKADASMRTPFARIDSPFTGAARPRPKSPREPSGVLPSQENVHRSTGVRPLSFHQEAHTAAQNYSSVALDYDALLDDLASIDYTERMEAGMQPQFMANLGFAPGCEIPESLMQEFGHVILP